jgi:beta-phosphoglucomutase-like phosphatase (HAD superfamily)
MASVEALIFDMDGTMIDSMPWHAKSWVEFIRIHGLTMSVDEVLRRTTGRTGVECMRVVFEQNLSDDECLRLVHQKEVLYREMFSPVFSEVDGFCDFAGEAAAKGFRIGVGTAGDRHNLAFAFSHLKMETAPEAVVGGDEGLPGKPDPAIFLEVARRLGVPPSACIVFEDAPFGIEAARRAGMRAIAVCSTHTPGELAGPHVMAAIRNYNELLKSNFLGNIHVS